MRTASALIVSALALAWAGSGAAQQSRPRANLDSALIASLTWRSIGPANMSGRITDIEGLPSPSKTFYVAAASGGIWKTTNNGTTFRPIFDDQRVISMGDIAIAPSDSLQIWAGTGEEDSRNSISPGGGIFKSVDGGKSWQFMGLEETHAIGRIVVHPTNPDIVYVAALGHIWGSNPERGLYKTTDGGKTWQLSKFISDKAGFVDVAMHPTNPEVLFAASWERVRGPYFLQSGGPGSALWKTTDGGRTWTEVRGGGFPETRKGRIGIAISKSNPDVIYTMVEADSLNKKKLSGLYRSGDGGATWTLQNTNNVRPFYYSQVRVDPSNPDYVFWSSTPVNFSKDGGKTVGTATIGIHVDHHAMWWDPADANHFIVGNDGGIGITWDKGGTYDFVNTIPLGQFYEVSYDMAVPYNVCGGLQDNGSWCGPSRRAQGDISNHMWFTVNGGDGFFTQQDPRDPNIVYAESQGGNMARINLATGERVRLRKPNWRELTRAFEDSILIERGDTAQPATPQYEQRAQALRTRIAADSVGYDLRYNWNTPFLLSPHDPDVFYAGANRVLKSTKKGEDLKPISPELSYADSMKIRVSTRATGGVTRDVTGAETYGTIVALTESPLRKGMLIAGTDDGRVWMTRDDGGNWEELTSRFTGMPRFSYVRRIEPSRHDANIFYVAFDRHRDDDFAPYLFMTTDGGKTFRSIARGLPTGGPDFVHVVREDPVNPNLLFVGTDVGVYVSLDRGATWKKFMTGLPTVPVHDLQIHPRDRELIAGTHGRSIWIVDIAPLQQLRQATILAGNTPVLFDPKPALQYGDNPIGGESPGHKLFRGRGVQYGAELTYWIPEGMAPAIAEVTARATAERPTQAAARARGQAAERTDAEAAPADTPTTRPPRAGQRDSARGGQAQRAPQASVVILSAAGDTLQKLSGPMRIGLNRVYWNLRRTVKRDPLSPSERRDSIAYARQVRLIADSLIQAGAEKETVDRAVNAMLSGDRGALFRGGSGESRSGTTPINERPGESYPGTQAAREAGTDMGEISRQINAELRDRRVRTFSRTTPNSAHVEPGEYTVAITLGDKTVTQKVRVIRDAGFVGVEEFGFE